MNELGREPGQRPRGRPRRADPPRFPADDVDRLLVHGETVRSEESGREVVIFPSHTELARRFGVARSTIGTYAARHRCMERRQEAIERTRAATTKTIVEGRSQRAALSIEEMIGVCDRYILAFAEALEEGRVRCDTPADLNTIMRLRMFLEGGADSRQEIAHGITLEALQRIHQESIQAEVLPPSTDGAGESDPPRAAFEGADGEAAAD